jgi:hypothetical protein
MNPISFFAYFVDDQSNSNHEHGKSYPMKTDESCQPATVFLQNLPSAVSSLKNRLQRRYEQSYPSLRDLIRIVLHEEEATAWNLSPFPHLLLPDLVEERIARLGLQPIEYETLFRPVHAEPNPQLVPAYAS